MSDTIQITKSVFQLLKEDLQRSVHNLPSGGKTIGAIDIDDHSLVAMMVLLRFHPDEQIAKVWNERILQMIKKRKEANKPLGGRPPKRVWMPKYSNDPYMEAINLIAEYGQYLLESRERREAQEKAAQSQKPKRKARHS